MAKVSKNHRTDRGKKGADTPMVRLIVSEQKESGPYRFRSKMVPEGEVREEIEKIRG